MTMSKMVWAGGAISIALVAVGVGTIISEDQPSPQLIVHNSGFAQVMPPGNFYGPGTINTVEPLEDGSLKLHPTCDIAEEDLVVHHRVSPTVERSFMSVVEGRINAEVSAKVLPSLGFAGKEGQVVQLKLKNVSQILISDEWLFKIRDMYLTGACEQAIVHNLKAGATVCQTAFVLQVDLVYRVSRNLVLTAEQRGILEEKVKASLGIGGNSDHFEEMRGDSLYFGVRLMTECIVLPGVEAKRDEAGKRLPS